MLQRHVGRTRHAGMHLPALALAGLAHDASLAPPDGGVIDRLSLVTPARRVVLFAVFVPTGEQARGVGALKVLGNDRGRVGVDLDVLLEVFLVLEDVVDQASQERDIGARPDGRVYVAHRRGAGEARVDVDELGYEVVLFVVYGGPADGGQGHRAVQLLALRILLFPGLIARLLDAVGD